MSSNQPYTLQDLQERINTLVENDNDVPDTTDDEWTTRLNLIHIALGKVESQDTLWDELWGTYAHAAPIVANTRTYALSALTDRRAWGSWVRLTVNGGTSYVPVVKPYTFNQMGRDGKVVYFTGNNRDGWTMNLGWTPTDGDGTVGATIELDYYRYFTRLVDPSDVSEISDPNFIIFDVAASKSLMESRNNQFSIYSTEAQRVLDSAKVMNQLQADGSGGKIEDLDAVNVGAVMGG